HFRKVGEVPRATGIQQERMHHLGAATAKDALSLAALAWGRRPIDPVHGPGQVYVQAPPRIPVAYPHVPEHLAASRGEKTGHDHGHIMDRLFLTARTGNLLHRLSHPPRGLSGISRISSGPRLYHEANPTPAHRPDHDEV